MCRNYLYNSSSYDIGKRKKSNGRLTRFDCCVIAFSLSDCYQRRPPYCLSNSGHVLVRSNVAGETLRASDTIKTVEHF